MEPAFLIAVMGATGAGKSSLIKAITGIQTDVANGPESGTSEVKEYFFHPSNGQPFILLDTPGFDDSTGDAKRSDLGIMTKLKSFLKTYGDSRKLSGLLYLHNIQDERDKGPSQRCLTAMNTLCGHDLMKKIVVITTFWDDVPVEEGVEYEDRLRKKYTYKTFSDAGVKFVRWQNDATDKALTDLRVDSLASILFDLAALGSASSVMPKEPGHVTKGTGAREGEETSELTANQELARGLPGADDVEPMVGLVEGTTQQEGNAKPQDISSETTLIANLRNELGLLKDRHAEDIRDFQSEIKQLKDDHANSISHQTQLAETCKILSTTVSGLSLSLTDLRKTSKQALADLIRECQILCATAREGERSSKSDLLSSQLVQARLAAELEEARLELAKIKSDLLQASQRERPEGLCSCLIMKSAPVKGKEKKRLDYDASLEDQSPSTEVFQPESDIEWGTTSPADDDTEDGDGWGSEFLTPSEGDAVQQGSHSDVKEAETVPKMLSELADMIYKEKDAPIVFQQWRWV